MIHSSMDKSRGAFSDWLFNKKPEDECKDVRANISRLQHSNSSLQSRSDFCEKQLANANEHLKEVSRLEQRIHLQQQEIDLLRKQLDLAHANWKQQFGVYLKNPEFRDSTRQIIDQLDEPRRKKKETVNWQGPQTEKEWDDFYDEFNDRDVHKF